MNARVRRRKSVRIPPMLPPIIAVRSKLFFCPRGSATDVLLGNNVDAVVDVIGL